ncbi:MAG TPA: DUF4388 domain-containing protein, partial [Thermoanaerobaculia bacterium]
MGVSGNLNSMLPGDLLQWLSLGQKSGTLVVTNKEVEKKIFFRSGRVISSASNDPREYLGQFLMSHGYLNEEELRKAMEVQQQSGILLGKILVMIGLINEEDLTRLMRLKAEEEIYDVFLWQEGEFHFIDNELPQMEMVPLKVDVTGIIMEGTRRVDEWPRIREVIPSDAFIPVKQKPIEVDEEFDEVQTTIVDSIDGKRTIAEIVLESRSASFVVNSTIVPLIRGGFVALRDVSADRAAAVVEEPMLPTAGFSESEEINTMLTAAQNALRNKDFEKTQRLLKAAQNLDPNHPKVRSAIKGAEAVIMGELRAQGIHDSKIPRVTRSLDEITTMNFTPNEGFMLSRING